MLSKKTISALIMVPALAIALPACASTQSKSYTSKGEVQAITEADVAAAQTAWGEGIVAIGAAFTAKEDYRAAATSHINKFYAYGEHDVLFKPTLAAEDQFRGSFDEALSYFVGGSIAEDKGFAIAPYTAVRWENEGTIVDGDSAMAMGNYYFTGTNGQETKVEYTFGYVRDKNGDLKIVLHHSSIPFSAN